jgi:uncharacterized membrane protein YfcA
LAGIAGGFIAGLIGIGGGLIYVLVIPEALKAFGVNIADIPKLTIANSLFAIFIGSLAVNYLHFKEKIYVREILLVGLPSVLSAIFFIRYLVNTPYYSIVHFNLITLLIMVYLLVSTYLKRVDEPIQNHSFRYQQLSLLAIGVLSGALAALSGLGGGIVVIPMLHILMHYPIKQASVVSSGVIMVSTLLSSIYNFFQSPAHPIEVSHSGMIVWPVVMLLSVGVAISSGYGVRYAKKLSPERIRHIFLIIVLIVILKKVTELLHILS